MGEYDCWGDDHEDLTNQVRMKVLTESTPTTYVLRFSGGGNPRHWRVIVQCSKGHDNSFEGEGMP